MKRELLGLGGIKKSTFPIYELGDFTINALNGYCIRPSLKPTTTKTLKLNAISPSGYLDKKQSKFVRVDQKIKDRALSYVWRKTFLPVMTIFILADPEKFIF